jgi:hypothetical protein
MSATIETRLRPGFLLPAQIATCHRITMRESIVILAQARTQASVAIEHGSSLARG